MRSILNKNGFPGCAALLAAVLAIPVTADASELGDAAQALQPGEWIEFSTTGFGKSLLEACGDKSILEWSNKGVWNPIAKEVHFVGQGHYSCAKHIYYREVTNSWGIKPNIPSGIDEEGPGHGYEHNTINPLTGDFYYRNYNSAIIEKFDPVNETWSSLPSVGSRTQVAGGVEYFPDAQGILFADGDWGVSFYDEPSKSWSLLANTTLSIDGSKPTTPMGSYHNFASYNPSAGVVYFGGGNGSTGFYQVDSQKRVSQRAASPVSIGINSAMTVADPASGEQLVFANDGKVYEYDNENNVWLDAGTHPVMSYAQDWRIVIPISDYGVLMFLTWNFDNSKVLLHRYAPGSGTPVDTMRPAAPSGLAAN